MTAVEAKRELENIWSFNYGGGIDYGNRTEEQKTRLDAAIDMAMVALELQEGNLELDRNSGRYTIGVVNGNIYASGNRDYPITIDTLKGNVTLGRGTSA